MACCREAKTKRKAQRIVHLARTATRLEARAAEVEAARPKLAGALRGEAAKLDRVAEDLLNKN